jgi:hypothetical protein
MKKIRAKARAVEGSEIFGFTGTGKEQIGFRIQVLEGEFEGESFSWYGFFTEASGQRTIDSLKYAGWNEDWNAFAQKRLPGLGSTEFELQLEEEEDQDEQGNPAGTSWRATFINRIGVAMKSVMDEGTARAFAARMKAMYGGTGAQTQQPRRAPAPNAGQRGAAPRTQPQTQQGAGFPDDAPPPDDVDF